MRIATVNDQGQEQRHLFCPGRLRARLPKICKLHDYNRLRFAVLLRDDKVLLPKVKQKTSLGERV